MKYSIYNTSTGIIHTQGSSTHLTNLSDILLESGEGIIEGHYDRRTQKIVDGVVTSYTADIFPEVRRKRDALLAKSDWTQMSDSPLTDSKKTEWATYRQTLRDIPSTQSTVTDIDNITWPSEPS
jgi:hypothetical protein